MADGVDVRVCDGYKAQADAAQRDIDGADSQMAAAQESARAAERAAAAGLDRRISVPAFDDLLDSRGDARRFVDVLESRRARATTRRNDALSEYSKCLTGLAKPAS